jgi:hypothetical protein
MHPHTIGRLGRERRAELMLEARVRQSAASKRDTSRARRWFRLLSGALRAPGAEQVSAQGALSEPVPNSPLGL